MIGKEGRYRERHKELEEQVEKEGRAKSGKVGRLEMD
jgi:hypothetical protein